MTKKRKGRKPVVKGNRPSNYIDMTMSSGTYQVSTYRNTKGGFTVIACNGDKVLEKKRVAKLSEVQEEYFKMCEKHVPNAEYTKGIVEDAKQSGPDSEGCAGGHCPIR